MTDDRDPRLHWGPEGEPRSGRFGDIYFSADDGLAETRTVFLEGCGLPDAWAGRRRFVVGELGFGSGLNIAALLTLWRDTRAEGARLNIFSVEAFPLSAGEARRALAAWPEVAPAAEALLAAWPDGAAGRHRLDLPAFGAVLDLHVGSVEAALDQWSGRADAWFLDGFSPALNPEMWSETVLDGVAARSAPGARLATFTVAGHVRRGLAARGFLVEKRPGHGRKRERLEARLASPAAADARPSVTAVVGAGAAGAAVARALVAEGLRVVVVDPEDGTEASGFPLALVTPRLDVGDAAVAAFHVQALRRAGVLYAEAEGVVAVEGVLQLEASTRDARRFDRVAGQAWWSVDAMKRLDAAATAAVTGEETGSGGLWMKEALAVRPIRLRDAFLAGAERIRARVDRLERAGDAWRLLDAAGALLVEAEQVVLAGGWAGAALWPDGAPLSPVRGQAEWGEGSGSRFACAWGGYAVSDGSVALFGATHDRDEIATDVRPADRARNLRTLSSRLPRHAARMKPETLRSRAAVRATTPDSLPLAGRVQEGLFVLGGLGSRGFCTAPLLGEHLAAEIAGAPSPLCRDHLRLVDPLRFEGKALRRG